MYNGIHNPAKIASILINISSTFCFPKSNLEQDAGSTTDLQVCTAETSVLGA